MPPLWPSLLMPSEFWQAVVPKHTVVWCILNWQPCCGRLCCVGYLYLTLVWCVCCAVSGSGMLFLSLLLMVMYCPPSFRYVLSGDSEGRCFFWEWAHPYKVMRTIKAHDGVCIGAAWHPQETSKVRGWGAGDELGGCCLSGICWVKLQLMS